MAKKSITLTVDPDLLLETDADKIRNHITPIMAYAELILSGKMGPVTQKQRKKIEAIRAEAKRMNFLLKTFKKGDYSKSSFVKNKIVNLELKLALSKNELREKTRQIRLLKKKKARLCRMREEKKSFVEDINSISSQITTVQNKVNKNTRLLLSFTVVLSIITASGFLIFNGDYVKVNADVIAPIKSKYLIENLRGDTIDTWLSWRLVKGDTLTVNILNAAKYDPKVIETIKKTILSEEVLEIDNSFLHKGPKGTTSLMYVGWQGAMKEAAKTETTLYVPAKFKVIESASGEGDIIIELSNSRNADGFSGWTNSIADASQNQILKSRVTIFAVDSMSSAALETIVRHELGHALGLAHSTAPEDLMYPTIETNFPYISECDVDAIERLYDGANTSEVICET